MRIVLLGAPGAGKGTQCKQIADKYSLLHLSSGDILRKERSEGTELGRKAQDYMDSGALVPDELIVEMMAGAIKIAPGSGFILDGFPRTLNQAVELSKSLEAAGTKIDVVVNLTIADEIVAQRMTGRRSCPVCGAVYHLENLKPAVDGKCDKDGADLVQRADDTFDVVQNRLKTYHEQTEPIVDYYKQTDSCSVYDIDAAQPVKSVTQSVFQSLDSKRS